MFHNYITDHKVVNPMYIHDIIRVFNITYIVRVCTCTYMYMHTVTLTIETNDVDSQNTIYEEVQYIVHVYIYLYMYMYMYYTCVYILVLGFFYSKTGNGIHVQCVVMCCHVLSCVVRVSCTWQHRVGLISQCSSACLQFFKCSHFRYYCSYMYLYSSVRTLYIVHVGTL